MWVYNIHNICIPTCVCTYLYIHVNVILLLMNAYRENTAHNTISTAKQKIGKFHETHTHTHKKCYWLRVHYYLFILYMHACTIRTRFQNGTNMIKHVCCSFFFIVKWMGSLRVECERRTRCERRHISIQNFKHVCSLFFFFVMTIIKPIWNIFDIFNI